MKVGDKVRIISKLEFRAYSPSYGGGVYTPNFLYIDNEMIKRYEGRNAIITKELRNDGAYIGKRYRINIDGGC